MFDNYWEWQKIFQIRKEFIVLNIKAGVIPKSLGSLALADRFFTTETPGKHVLRYVFFILIEVSVSSVQFSCSVVSDSLQPHESQQARLEKAMAPHSRILAWKIPWTEEPGQLQSMGWLRVGHGWATSLSLSCIGEGNGNPLQCSCLENPEVGGAWWAAVCGVVWSRTWLKRLSSSSSSSPPCPTPTPGVHPNSCPLSWWCHPTISSSVVPFSSCPQSFLASGSFQMSQLFASGDQSIVVSASTSVLPMNTQDWSPLGWTGWISLQSKGPSRVFSNTTVQKHQFFGAQLSSQSNSHNHTWPQEKL